MRPYICAVEHILNEKINTSKSRYSKALCEISQKNQSSKYQLSPGTGGTCL